MSDEPDKPLPCIVCKTQLRESIGWTQPSGGVLMMDHGAYGSRFDDSAIAFTICDDCLIANREIVRTYRRVNPRVTVEWSEFAPWIAQEPSNITRES